MSDTAVEAPRITLEVLATSDVHGVIISDSNLPNPTGGLSRIATLVETLRQKNPNHILLDNGDFLQGTPMCDFAASGEIDLSDGHPVIQAMNRIGYDAAGLGNHEFDFGLDFLNETLKQAKFPIVGSNVASENQAWHKSIVLERRLKDQYDQSHLVKIGLFSVMPEQVSAWNARFLDGRLSTRDITETARSVAKSLRRSGAQIVIGLLHSGLGAIDPQPRQENAVIPIANLADVDAIICGHTHQTLPDHHREDTELIDFAQSKICDVPAVMPGFNGDFLGQITLELELNGATVRVSRSKTGLHSLVPSSPSDEPKEHEYLHQIGFKATLACASLLTARVGELRTPVHSFFSRLPGDPAVALVAQAQLEFARRELQDALPPNAAIVSAASPFKGGGRGGPNNFAFVPTGPVTRQDLTQLNPFQNTLVALELSGSQLRDWLEMSASNFNQIKPNSSGTPLRDSSFPCYGFDTVFGVTYTIDLTQPARFNVLGEKLSDGSRISNLCLKGVPLSMDQDIIMLTTSYRAGGGGNFPNVFGCRRLDIPTKEARTLLADFLMQGVEASDLPTSPWQFKPIENASATAPIGPGVLPLFALGHRPEVEIISGAIDETGFVPFTVNLAA